VILILLSQVLCINAQYIELVQIYTGNDYLELSENERISYVTGLIDMMFYRAHSYNPIEYEDLIEVIQGMSALQIKKIFEKYLEENPEEVHNSAAELFDFVIVFTLL